MIFSDNTDNALYYGVHVPKVTLVAVRDRKLITRNSG